MDKTRKRLFIIVGILMCMSLTLNICLYMAFYVFPNQLKVNYTELKSSKIPQSLNDVSIVYFTDLQYGEFETEEKFENLLDTIKDLNPDILIFGGDFFDSDFETNDELNWQIMTLINEIEAPLGKYAVWGEKDIENENHLNALNWIYSQSQIEVLNDSCAKITNREAEGIYILGLSNEPNYDYISANTNSNNYNLLITHKPDNLTNSALELASIDLALAGHSHGTQISIPIYGGYQTIEGASTINHDKGENLSFDYIISTGVGCTNINARFNSTPEIYNFVLKSKGL